MIILQLYHYIIISLYCVYIYEKSLPRVTFITNSYPSLSALGGLGGGKGVSLGKAVCHDTSPCLGILSGSIIGKTPLHQGMHQGIL